MNRYLYLFIFLCLFTIVTFTLFEAAGLSWDGMLKSTDSKLLLALISILLLGSM